MKHRKYTRKKKIWALFLFILFMGITVAGGLGLYYVNNFSGYLFSKKELLQTSHFEDTETLERKILNETSDIFEYTSLSQIYGNQDEDNIRTPIYIARINQTDYNLCLKDLQGIAGVLNEYYGEMEPFTAGSGEAADTSGALSETGGIVGTDQWLEQYLNKFAFLYSETYFYRMSEEMDTEESQKALMNEWYEMPNEAKEAVIKAEGWEGYYGDTWPARYTLESTAEILIYPEQMITLYYDYIQQADIREQTDFFDLYARGSDSLERYYMLQNQLAEEETNLKYILHEPGSDIWKHNGSVDEEELCQMEKYVSYDSETHRIRTNFTEVDVEDWNLEYLSSSVTGTKKGLSFTVALDTRYSVKDEYRSMSAAFGQCRPILILSLLAILIGFLGAVPSFIYLLASVGHQEDYDGIRLDKFDQWPTESSALLIIGGIFLFIGLCSVMAQVMAHNFFTSKMIYRVMSMIATVVSVIIGLVGFFSMVKRMKAGILWKNSLFRKGCVKIGKWGKAIVAKWPVSGKAAAVIILYWLTTIPLCMFITINRFWGSRFLYVTGILVFAGIQLAAAGVLMSAVMRRKTILDGVEKIAAGDLEYVISDEGMYGSDKKLVEGINNIGAGLQDAVDTAVKSERMKADLITNVSHDIKTPLTSIINYVDLMKRENIEDETLRRYLEVLDQKSQRLKNLTEDLVEASRASSGNISLQLERINFVELVKQACGEFTEKFEERNLTAVTSFPDHALHVIADGRRVWRIIENLFQNTKKYAMPGTRVYVSVEETEGYACFTMKNISESELNISAEELTERFTRGDTSRTTEGSGLGLSIARSLTELQNGIFEIYLNGDLFQVSVQFEVAEEPEISEEPDGDESGDGSGAADSTGEEAKDRAEAEPSRYRTAPESQAQGEAGSDGLTGASGGAEAEAEARFIQEAMEELKSSGLLKGASRR